ncbi:hypothetical protein J5Y04_31070 [Kitasatospora sp. RG8]|uniref:hypothetical protein n=1 Tax=Kitasatospora sp. RG8 TaxID=2820815 RepID=UPI001ADECB91|nr:hypothetical protein [Kitasatospora sp. RG8]MBP0453950.1 hypothetical protein [Kitasatospora sp. RG8]
MHDPELPDPSPADTGSGTPEDTGDYGLLYRIAEKMETVAAWYTEQIHAERQRPGPNPDRVEQLLAVRAAITRVLRELPEMTGAELERIEALYDARLSEINGA